MKINLDITGMYYGIEVNVTDNATVLDVMKMARGRRAANGGVLDYKVETVIDPKTGLPRQFIDEITVDYDAQSAPSSRQYGPHRTAGDERAKGLYKYNDNISNPAYVIPGGDPRIVSFRLVWQYYIMDNNGQLRNGKIDGFRQIVAASESNRPDGGVKLQDHDRIVWRAVAIFGLDESIAAAIAKANADAAAAGNPNRVTAADFSDGSLKNVIENLSRIQ
jgi:hypothetical protein